MEDILLSVIIPHKDSIRFLPKLLYSIPIRESIEVILVDNSPTKIKREDIGVNRPYKLLYSSPKRGAGGARNVGIENAHGRWLVFADADDYFADTAFDAFFLKVNSEADIVYFCMDGVYIDSGERSNRGDGYTQLVRNYLSGHIPEENIRFNFSSPCAKMVKRDFVISHDIRYDEVTASNDVYFSLLTGFYAKKIEAVDKTAYIITVSRGSLTRRRDYAVTVARYEVNLRYNQFLRQHDFSKYQRSILYYALLLCKMGIRQTLLVIKLLLKYEQNPFVGYKNWIRTNKKVKDINKKEKQYIVK